jgi:hypothetical protein
MTATVQTPEPRKRGMLSRTYGPIILGCFLQYLGVISGVYWGLGLRYRILPSRSEDLWPIFGVASVILLIRECRPISPTSPSRRWGSAMLACLAVYIMITEKFLFFFWSEEAFVIGALMITPFLLGVGPLLRAKAYLGVVGESLFVMTSSAMMTRNAFSLSGGRGFFTFWIS